MKYTIVSSALALAIAVVSAAPASKPSLPQDTSVLLTKKINALQSRELQERSSIYGWTANELSKCAKVTVIFARGTIEPGNVGYLAGPPFFDALAAIIGGANLDVQGVPYP